MYLPESLSQQVQAYAKERRWWLPAAVLAPDSRLDLLCEYSVKPLIHDRLTEIHCSVEGCRRRKLGTHARCWSHASWTASGSNRTLLKGKRCRSEERQAVEALLASPDRVQELLQAEAFRLLLEIAKQELPSVQPGRPSVDKTRGREKAIGEAVMSCLKEQLQRRPASENLAALRHAVAWHGVTASFQANELPVCRLSMRGDCLVATARRAVPNSDRLVPWTATVDLVRVEADGRTTLGDSLAADRLAGLLAKVQRGTSFRELIDGCVWCQRTHGRVPMDVCTERFEVPLLETLGSRAAAEAALAAQVVQSPSSQVYPPLRGVLACVSDVLLA